jgi:hypothetical protein
LQVPETVPGVAVEDIVTLTEESSLLENVFCLPDEFSVLFWREGDVISCGFPHDFEGHIVLG